MLLTPSEKIRKKAASLGFDLCGIARCRVLKEPYEAFQGWIEQGCDGGLNYLRRNQEKRFDPRLLVEDARSVVVCGVSYHHPKVTDGVWSRIASYAHAKDYHITLREPLAELLAYIQEVIPGSGGRVFTDTAPLAEKSWAQEAGLGWIGRNSLLIHPHFGSFLLLGEVVTMAELEPDKAFTQDGCGVCRACVDACPVAAIRPDRMIDARLCIARQTIEPHASDDEQLHGWIFGCDACQRVCPRNWRAPVSDHPWFAPPAEFWQQTPHTWLALSNEDFKTHLGETPLSRCGIESLQRRIRVSFNIPDVEVYEETESAE